MLCLILVQEFLPVNGNIQSREHAVSNFIKEQLIFLTFQQFPLYCYMEKV